MTIDTLFGDEIGVTAIDRDALTAAITGALSQMSLDDVVAIIANPYKELMEYVALSLGDKHVGQKISLLFNPHRLTTRTRNSKMSVYEALRGDHDTFHSGLARAAIFKQGKYSPGESLYHTIQLGINGVQYVNEFPPHVVRDFCLSIGLNSTSRFLDPCAGWGGRLIGASVTVGSYTGYEPSTRTHSGLLRLQEFIAPLKPDFRAEVHCQPYEDSTEREAFYDFAMTSPPYFDTEQYADEDTQSSVRYPTFDEWCDGFYFPLVDKTMRQLKPGAMFVVNIGSRVWPLRERLHQHVAGRYGIRDLSGRLAQGGSNGLKKEADSGETFYSITHR